MRFVNESIVRTLRDPWPDLLECRLVHPPRGEMKRRDPQQVAEVLARPLSRELLDRGITRLAYVAADGTPRAVPIAFVWNGSDIVMCTPTNAPKLAGLRRNPAVALTFDTEEFPPKILLVRGRAELDVADAAVIAGPGHVCRSDYAIVRDRAADRSETSNTEPRRLTSTTPSRRRRSGRPVRGRS